MTDRPTDRPKEQNGRTVGRTNERSAHGRIQRQPTSDLGTKEKKKVNSERGRPEQQTTNRSERTSARTIKQDPKPKGTPKHERSPSAPPDKAEQRQARRGEASDTPAGDCLKFNTRMNSTKIPPPRPEKPPHFPPSVFASASSLMCKRPPRLASREMLLPLFRPIHNQSITQLPLLDPATITFWKEFGGLVDAEEEINPGLVCPVLLFNTCPPGCGDSWPYQTPVDVAAHNTQRMPHFNPFVISSLVPCQFSLVSFISSPSIGPISGICLCRLFTNPRYPHGLCGNAGSIAEGTKSVITISQTTSIRKLQ